MSVEKKQLREKFLALRESLTLHQQTEKSEKILQNFLMLSQLQNAKMVALYASLQSEVQTHNFLDALKKQGKKVCLPKTQVDKQMEFFEVYSWQDCALGNFKILEPLSSCKQISAEEIDLILVPGLAFDWFGHRLGYGAGFYDRYLPRAKNAHKIGLTYAQNFVKQLPKQDHDFALDIIITEEKIHAR